MFCDYEDYSTPKECFKPYVKAIRGERKYSAADFKNGKNPLSGDVAQLGNKKGIGNNGGRVKRNFSVYDEDWTPRKAYKLALLGATDDELATYFEVGEATIRLWKTTYPAFAAALKKGGADADANVTNRLYKRAMGYDREVQEAKVVSNGDGAGSSIEKVDVRKHYPPDTMAAMFWLQNRQSAKWRNVKHVDVTSGGKGFFDFLMETSDTENKEEPKTIDRFDDYEDVTGQQENT